MARRVTGQWMACVLVLAVGVWHGAIGAACLAASLPPAADGGEEDVPDMNHVRHQADAGRPKAQTQLADFYLSSSDFTNAVFWYRKAADQNHVPAQLSLAGCLMAGRGTAKNPTAAAGWLRKAADLIESGSAPQTAVRAAPATATASSRTITRVEAKSIVISRESPPQTPTNARAKPAVPTVNLSPARPTVTNPPPSGRVVRVDALASIEPVLQEARPPSGPSDRP